MASVDPSPRIQGSSWRIVRRSPRNKQATQVDADENEDATLACCMPMFRRRRSSRADSKDAVSQSTSSTTGDGLDESPLKESLLNPSTSRMRSRRASLDVRDDATEWHSCVSSMSYIDDLLPRGRQRAASVSLPLPLSDADKATGWERLPQLGKIEWPQCTCGFSCHTSEFDPALPLITPREVMPGSYEEALVLAKAMIGNWLTILPRSDSLDPQMRHLGIGAIKRGVMNRLAVPLSAKMEDDDLVLHAQIHTPLGPKSMHAHLRGKEMIDNDSDCGLWNGVAKVVDFSDKRFCNGRPVRGIQLLRKNPKFGICFETRVVVPDKEEGRVMLFNLSLFPVEPEKAPIIVTRVLKYVGPIDKN